MMLNVFLAGWFASSALDSAIDGRAWMVSLDMLLCFVNVVAILLVRGERRLAAELEGRGDE
jgi:hypothetical protein